MSVPPKELGKWILQSFYKAGVLHQGDWHLYLEGEKRDTNLYPKWVELRVDGPFLFALQGGWWKVQSEVNALVNVLADTNIYTLDLICGEVASFLASDVKIMNGNVPVGCMQMSSDWRDGVKVSKFGQVDVSTALSQATVESHFTMEVKFD